MQILKSGTLPPKPNEDYRGECENCHCIVKCKPTDHAIMAYSKSNPVFRVKCPTVECGGVITLAEYLTRAATTPPPGFSKTFDALRGKSVYRDVD